MQPPVTAITVTAITVTAMLDPVYDIDGTVLHPHPHASGPWFDGVQHGGAIAGLLARAVELTPCAAPMDLTRLTIELVRKVPMGPTTVDVEVTREGKRIQSLALSVIVGDEVVTRATALRIRAEEGAVEADLLHKIGEDHMPPPESVPRHELETERADFWNCFDHRQVIAPEDRDGVEMAAWYRMLNPLVAGEETSALVRMACNADFAMTASWLLGFDEYMSPNPDLTVALRRHPTGEWFGLHSRVWADTRGIGQSEAALFDETGQVGRATKSLLISKR